MILEKKICGRCGIEKLAASFQIRRKPNGYSWLRLECKDCQNRARKNKYKSDVEYRRRVLNRNIDYYNTQRGTRLIYFKKYRKENIDEIKTNGKIKYKLNAEKVKENRRKYYRINPEKHKAIVREYTKNNKAKLLAAKRANHRGRRDKDLHYRLMKILRSRLTSAIKSNGRKCLKTRELVGCSMDELRSHLENQFCSGMNWCNHGVHGWHIDHKIPCAAFDLTKPEEQRKCFHYTNLQPLWGIDNMKKGAKYEASYSS